MGVLKIPLTILFKNQNPYRILGDYLHNFKSEKSSYEKIDKNVFINLYQEEENQYSKDDCENIYSIVKEYMKTDDDKLQSVFNILTHYSRDVLENCGDAVRCRYKDLLKWRQVSLKLDQDLFICAFLALEDINMNKNRKFFDWDVIIKSNNIRLHNLLSKGMSENHFHLKGSAPTFKLSWISLMNDLDCRKLSEELVSINRLEKDIDGEIDLEDAIAIAALLRIILFREVCAYDLGKSDTENLLAILKSILVNDSISNSYVIDKLSLSMNISILKDEINSLKYMFGCNLRHNSKNVKVDYALTEDIYTEDISTRLFIGERSFMYKCFKAIYEKDSKIMGKEDLFYVYIILKNKIRAELVQENKRVGFANFSDYQDRKCMYIKKSNIISDSVEPLAILTSIKNQNLVSLEARVIPRIKAIDNIKMIKDTDYRICNNICNDFSNYWIKNNIDLYDNEMLSMDLSIPEKMALLSKEKIDGFEKLMKYLEDKFFYVYHFPKQRDKEKINDDFLSTVRCRHYSYRKNLKETCNGIVEMREYNQQYADRILGIDACSNELFTRPEVFGQAFRYLKGHLPTNDIRREVFNKNSIQRLRATYHVGEDFLDVADGLRAVDEAIIFLNLTHGDRLGHATVLGIDVQEWYKNKLYKVYLSKQDILDNIAWLISKIKQFNVVAGPDAVDKLINIYNKYFVEIFVNDDYESSMSVVPVDTYITSWELRGDNPEAYIENIKNLDLGYWNRCSKRKNVNNKLAEKLYNQYHYDPLVKRRGAIKVPFKVEPFLIDIIIEIQKCMQNFVRERGIGIETNPSSNVLISTFKRYDKHPILEMYNKELCNNTNNYQNAPQLFVSINTDDQGVFDTLLENEFALMAIALEKSSCKYNQSEIYSWIDSIREMGVEQSFRVKKR